MQVPEVFFVNPNSLVAHPLLATIPMLDEASPEFQAMKASIADRGVDYPVIIDEDDRILDGRNRARAAAKVGAELPAVKRSSREATEIILSAILNRRHLPKGALAYLTVPLFQPAVEAGRQRRLSHLQTPQVVGNLREPTQSAHGTAIGKTVEQLAEEMGFSKDLYEQAVKVRKLFESTAVKTWHDGARVVECSFRSWFEPKILSGEIGLGGVIQAIAGKESTEGKTPEKRDLPTLFARALGDLKSRFARWESIAPDQRRVLASDFANEAATWPEDVRQKILAALEKAAVHKTVKPGY